VYFPLLFALHVGAISMIILYIPLVFSAVIGFLHFVCFLVLIILNICIKDVEPGNGSRTKGTRVVWGSTYLSIQSWDSSTSCSSWEDLRESRESTADYFVIDPEYQPSLPSITTTAPENPTA
jgi:hypothetical protein